MLALMEYCVPKFEKFDKINGEMVRSKLNWIKLKKKSANTVI